MTEATDAARKDMVCPNFQVSLAPNGFIMVNVGMDIISTMFYCDAVAAREISTYFTEAADALDDAMMAVEEAAKRAESSVDGGEIVVELDADVAGDVPTLDAVEAGVEFEESSVEAVN